MAKEGITGEENIRNHYKEICKIVDNNVSAEVIATDLEGILKEGRELARIDDKIVVKVPMIREGVKAIKAFSAEDIRTNCRLIFSAGQAMLAAKAGASYASPLIGRLDNIAYSFTFQYLRGPSLVAVSRLLPCWFLTRTIFRTSPLAKSPLSCGLIGVKLPSLSW